MRIYTKTGDRGETGLFGGGRVTKSHPRVDAYGEIDELNAALGWALTSISDPGVREKVASIQPDLFVIGARLASPEQPSGRRRPRLPALEPGRVETLEKWIDEVEAGLPELRSFILPGGSAGGAALHLARTVCRRAERRVVALAEAEAVEPDLLVYLNRLSDLLFVLARLDNLRAGQPEPEWHPKTDPER